MRYRVDYKDGLGFTSGDVFWALTRWGARWQAREVSRHMNGTVFIAKGATGPEVEWWHRGRRTYPVEAIGALS